jgi:acetyl-CoA carboxylase carboxyl transferase subunit alpha
MQAADALKPVADDLLALGIIDGIVPEPLGGAHRDYAATASALKDRLSVELEKLRHKDPQILMSERLNKYRTMGIFRED